MACDIIDLKCIFVNELVGNAFLAIIILTVIYLIVASKLRFGFDTTLIVGFTILLVGSLAIGNLMAIMAFGTILVGILLAIEIAAFIGKAN